MNSQRGILDASVLVDLLIQGRAATWVDDHLRGRELYAPAHMPSCLIIEPIGPLLLGA